MIGSFHSNPSHLSRMTGGPVDRPGLILTPMEPRTTKAVEIIVVQKNNNSIIKTLRDYPSTYLKYHNRIMVNTLTSLEEVYVVCRLKSRVPGSRSGTFSISFSLPNSTPRSANLVDLIKNIVWK